MPLHDPVKAEKVAATAAVALADKLVLPAYMTKETFDNYKGALNDTVNVKVEGVLPYHDYTWREAPEDREDIQFDVYKERKVGVTLGANMYSAVQLTDEQNELDLVGWNKLTDKMTDAVSNGLNDKANTFASNDANYDVTYGIHEGSIYEGLAKLRKVLGRLHTPGAVTIAASSDWISALLLDERLNLASNVGDSLAQSAAQQALIGRRLGFNIVEVPGLADDTAVAFGSGAFVMANAAPAVPQSAPWGATAGKNGVSMRVLRHYNHRQFVDEGVVNTWYGFRTVKDVLAYYDSAAKTSKVSDSEYQVRAVKLVLNGTGSIKGGDSGELSKATRIKGADLTVAAPAEPTVP